MDEQLLNSLKSEVGTEVLKQTNLPAANMDKVFSIVGDVAKSIFGRLLKR